MIVSRKSFSIYLQVILILVLAACAPTPVSETPASEQLLIPTNQPTSISTSIPTFVNPTSASPTTIATFTPVPGIPEEQDRLIPPIPPHDVSAVRNQDYVEISWMGTGVDIDTHYVVYRRSKGSEDWEAIANVLAEGDNTGQYAYQDYSASTVTSPEYAISTFNRYGKESMLSEIVSPE